MVNSVRGSRFLVEEDRGAVDDRLRKIVGFLQVMERFAELSAVPNWKVSRTKGAERGAFVLSTVDVPRRLQIKLLASPESGSKRKDGPSSMENPPHPGEFLQTEVIAPSGLSVTEAAAVLGITRGTLSTFLNMRSTLSTGMALRIEKAFDIRMDSLMRMQNCFDIAEARKREGEITIPRYTAANAT